MKPQFLSTAFLAAAVPALGLSSISTLAAGLAWLLIGLAGLSAWLGHRLAGNTPQNITERPALPAATWWLFACIAAFVLMVIPTAYWDGPWKERHPQWRLLMGALGLWLLLQFNPPSKRVMQALASAAALSSILAYGLVITVSSDAAPTNRIPWMAGLSLLSCALLSMSYSMDKAALRLRQFWLAASALMVVTVLLSGVRGSWALGFIWPAMLWCLHKSSPLLWRSAWRWLLPLLMILLMAGLLLIPEKDNPFFRVYQIYEETGLTSGSSSVNYDSSSGVRIGLYKTALEHVMDNPWLGSGHTTTKQLIREFLIEAGALDHLSIVGHLHNDMLHAWLEFGLFGLAGYSVVAVGLIVHARQISRLSKASGIAGFYILVMHLITGMSNMNFAHNYYPLMLSMCVALITLAANQATEQGKPFILQDQVT